MSVITDTKKMMSAMNAMSTKSLDPYSDSSLKLVERRAKGFTRARDYSTPMTRYGSVDSTSMYDTFANPLIDRQHLEFPKDRIKRNERYWDYFQHQPLLAHGIRLLVEFPISNFRLVHEDPMLEDFYNTVSEKLDLLTLLLNVGVQYYVLGEAIPFGFVDNPENPKMWTDFILLNPDWATINRSPVVRPRNNGSFGKYSIVYEFHKDPALKKIVTNGPKNPITKDLYSQIPEDILNAVRSGKPLKLPDLQASYFQRIGNYFTNRGESIIQSCVQPLMYGDKLRESQYAIADRHVAPTEIYKIGEPGQPATAPELAAFDDAMQSIWNGTNKAVIWHHALQAEWLGAGGKILPLRPEYDYIQKELLTALGLSEAFVYGSGPCLREDHEILTEDGWVHLPDVPDGTQLMTYNKDTGKSELQHFIRRIVQDYDGDLIHFDSNKIDCVVTPNHRMLTKVRKSRYKEGEDGVFGKAKIVDGKLQCVICGELFERKNNIGVIPSVCSEDCKAERNRRTSKNTEEYYEDWEVLPAEDIKTHYKLPVKADWDGASELTEVDIDGRKFDLKSYLRFAGWYVTEGWSNGKRLGLSQAAHKDEIGIFDADVSSFFGQDGILRYESGHPRHRIDMIEYITKAEDAIIAKHFSDEWGCRSFEKKIPKWAKQLPTSYLKELIDVMLLGDGNKRAMRKSKEGEERYNTYLTISPQLADDMQEIVWKTGRAPIMNYDNTAGNVAYFADNKKATSNYDKLAVMWSDGDYCGLEPVILKDTINSIPHNDKVYCYQVPNEFLVVRRNGKILIVGNTFANASVSLEVLVSRFLTFRQTLENFLLKQIFQPLCIWNNLVKPKKKYDKPSKYNVKMGVQDYELPEIKWDKQNLREDRERINMIMGMVETGKLPVEMLWTALNMDPTMVREKLKLQLKNMPDAPNILKTETTGTESSLPGDVPPMFSGGDIGGGDIGGDIGGIDLVGEGDAVSETVPPESSGDIGMPVSI